MNDKIREALTAYLQSKKLLEEAKAQFQKDSSKLFESAEAIEFYRGSRIKKFLVDDSLISLSFTTSDVDIDNYVSV